MALLFSYYGDDFTGSTDALEALCTRGVRTVLFPGIPSREQLERFSDYDAIGIAGESRSRNPEWMRTNLPRVFEFLRSLGAPVMQYKVCSTFDSSPEIGNIDAAMRIGREVFESACVPVVVAAPHLGRYVLFGNLFAAQSKIVYRIDRHPTMSRHPVTPMGESDLRLHLRAQGAGDVELVDILALTGTDPCAAADGILARNAGAVVFDGLDPRTELETGRILWNRRASHPFVVGSSGLTHAFMRWWRETGQIAREFRPPHADAVDRLLVVSGSCSPVTEEQIRSAQGAGFEAFHSAGSDRHELVSHALNALGRGRSIIIYSALGPVGMNGSFGGEELGHYLGDLMRDVVLQSGVKRAIIAGGDTSSHAMSRLGISALTFAAVMAPGAPLCRAESDTPPMNGLELVLKGGQVGSRDFFEQVRRGRV
jgi:3-oxoisoapionate kinase